MEWLHLPSEQQKRHMDLLEMRWQKLQGHNVHKRRRTNKAGQCTQPSTRPSCSRGQKDTYRTRQKTLSSIPSTRPSIQLEGKSRLTTSQEQFLQADDGDIDTILIFSTTENILHLCAAETIYCDGTFYTAPPMFDQIFTIHAFVGDVMFPLVFSLLPKRDTATYNRFFAILKDIASRHNLNLSPRRAACLPLLPLDKVEDLWLYTLENAPPETTPN